MDVTFVNGEYARLRYAEDVDRFVIEDSKSWNGTYFVDCKTVEGSTLPSGVKIFLAKSPDVEF